MYVDGESERERVWGGGWAGCEVGEGGGGGGVIFYMHYLYRTKMSKVKC